VLEGVCDGNFVGCDMVGQFDGETDGAEKDGCELGCFDGLLDGDVGVGV